MSQHVARKGFLFFLSAWVVFFFFFKIVTFHDIFFNVACGICFVALWGFIEIHSVDMEQIFMTNR